MERITRDYNQEYKDIPEKKYAYDFDNVLRRYMIRTFKPFLPKGRALEMGCFMGEFTQHLTQHYSDLSVIEASAELIETVQHRLGSNIKFIHSRFEDFQPDAPFDCIFLMHTLEHLDDPVGVLKKVNGWLSEQGYLFLVVPNANAPSRQIAVKMGLIPYNTAVTEAEFIHGHRCTYTFDTLEHHARQGGLEIIHRGGVFFKPFANYQFDQLMETDIISEDYLEGCYQLGMQYPDLCASIYLICAKGTVS